MNVKIIGIILAVILVIAAALVFIIPAVGKLIDDPEKDGMVEVIGRVDYNWAIEYNDGWNVYIDDVNIEKDNAGLFQFAPLWLWNSREITVEGTLRNPNEGVEYVEEQNIGKVGIDTSESKDFNLLFNDVKSSVHPYTLTVRVYEAPESGSIFDEPNLRAKETREDIVIDTVIIPDDTDEDYSDYDINKDGVVDQTDADYVQASYGATGDPGWIRCDINKDGVVDQLDLSLIVDNIEDS